MNRSFIIFVLFLAFSSRSGFCVAENSEPDFRVSQISFKDSLTDNQILYNGRVWRNLYYKVREDQFLFSGDFLTGSVTIDGKTFNNIKIRYDIYNDEIIIPTNNGSILQLNKEMVDNFNINYLNKSYHFTKIEEDSVKGFNGYVNILYNGEIPVYVKYKKEIELLAVEGKYDRFYEIHRLFIVKDSVIHQVNSRRELLKLLSENKVQIRGFIKKNRLSVSIKVPESIVPVIEYYDSLSQ